ncbi:MAG TPA: glycosyl hydrolase [Anaerolineae bacterium]|nr:hypothetical protein [Anaerolineaceae bacterium]HRV93477.1 glycosyl hydrolase [Anaerolineae bacterium]
MRKLNLPLVGLVYFAILLLWFGHVSIVFAQPQAPIQESAWLPQSRLFHETDHLSLVSSNVITVYLPMVYGPPPPRKGVGAPVSPACVDQQTLQASWYLNWRINPDPTCGAENANKFVPRISGVFDEGTLAQAVTNAQASGWLIGFSEPNLPWQGNLSPTQGAVLWRQIENAAIPAGVKLVSPSPNQYDPGQSDPYGHQWTWAMVDAYKALYGPKPHFDALGWNIYKRTPTEIQTYLNARRNEALARGYNVPFWILEYGGECWSSSKNGNTSVMTSITPWFETTPWIDRYAWFANRITGAEPYAPGWQSCSLINPSTGAPTSLGQIYVGYY